METSDPRRTSRACQRCKRKKIKCSGYSPCQHCIRHRSPCSFEERGKKVMISEKHLNHLQATISTLEDKIRAHASPSGDGRASDVEPSYHASMITPEESNNERSLSLASQLEIPVPTNADSAELPISIDCAGQKGYLDHSSIWAFNSRVRQILGEVQPCSSNTISRPAKYKLADDYSAIGRSGSADFPCLEYTEHMFLTTLFHLGFIFYVVDKQKFLHRLKDFYKSKANLRPLSTVWHAQVLLFIAMGKLFIRNGASELGPPGSAEFLRAMELIPDSRTLHSDPLLSIETLCLASLYLLSSDAREVAYSTIGQAQRIAQASGWNRELSSITISESEQEHRRRLWWTIYIIDVKTCASNGIPPSLQQDRISIGLPVPDDEFLNSALRIHSKIALVTAKVLDTAYDLKSVLSKNYLDGIQHVFSSMAEVSKDFTGRYNVSLGSTTIISRTSASLHIAYHQCMILAGRPLLWAAVQQRLRSLSQGRRQWRLPSESANMIIKACVQAAITNLKMITLLHQQHRVEPFFLFDVEAIASATLTLLLSDVAYIDDQHLHGDAVNGAIDIIQWMTTLGDRVAAGWVHELTQLRSIVGEITAVPGQISTLSQAVNAAENYACQPQSSAPQSEETNWLWNALDLEDSTMDGLQDQDFARQMSDLDRLENMDMSLPMLDITLS